MQLIKNPKPRTERWLSTSYPESEWDKPVCKIANADYFVHNLMSNVLFNDALKKIPSDAIIVEIGPHFLLQSILKRAIGNQAAYIGLMKRNEPHNVTFLMESLGKYVAFYYSLMGKNGQDRYIILYIKLPDYPFS